MEVTGVMLRSSKLLVVCLLAPLLLAAPQSEERAAQVKERMAELQARLKLTPDQTDKLRPIVRNEMEELKAVRDKFASDTSRRGKRRMVREMQGVRKKYEPQISALLTPEQQSEWKKVREERQQQMKQKRGL